MFYFPKSRPRREMEWRIRRPTQSPAPTVMPHTGKPQNSSTERVRIIPGMAPESVVVTGYADDGHPVTRMEIPKRWLTPQFVAWVESRVAQEDGSAVPQLKLLG